MVVVSTIPRIVYFDTNFYLNLADDIVPKARYTQMKELRDSGNFKCFYTPVAFVEMGSHLVKHEAQGFDRYRRAFVFVAELCGNNILDNPDCALASVLKIPYAPLEKPIPANELNEVRDLICNSQSFDHLVSARFRNWHGIPSLVKYQASALRKFRNTHERQWINDMAKQVVRVVNPRYEKRLAKGKSLRLTSEIERNGVISFLASLEFSRAFVEACHAKATAIESLRFISQMSEPESLSLCDKLSAYFEAYKSIIRRNVTEGYRPKPNDLNDLNQLIYLGLGDHVTFVTSDRVLTNHALASKQRSQIVTPDELPLRFVANS